MKYLFKIIVLLSVLFSSERLFAQTERDKVEALRVAFISKKLELSTSESEKFWPLYNEYNDKIKAIKRNVRQSYNRKGLNASNEEAEELYQLDIQSRQAETDVHKQYSEKIKAVIGAKKLVKLRLAEEEFKREIINSIKEKSE